MNIVFYIEGGIGKNIAATAVCKAIKKQYPNDNLFVITGYPVVFYCNPNIYKVLSLDSLSYFYKDNIEGKNVKIFIHNPYFETDFISNNGHLIKVWCEMYDVKYSGELPELFITNRELIFYSHQFTSEKPIMLLQTNGGADNQTNKYSWMRDLSINTAQTVVDAFAKEYNIVHIRRENQLSLKNVTSVQLDFRAIATLILMSEKRLLIDSFVQHAAAALGKSSVVCWIGNQPEQLGYEIHTNIKANEPSTKLELRNSVFSKYNITGQNTEFPFNNESEIFNADIIIDILKNDLVEVATDSSIKNNSRIKEKIFSENNRGSMVAQRLKYLAGKIDLTNIKQVLDIGSWHLGQSIEFSNIFHNANIDAFEPVPDSYQLCVRRHMELDEQKMKRINIHNIAISNLEEEIPFYPIDSALSSTPNIGASSMFKFINGLNGSPFGQTLIQKEIKVTTKTLDNWCLANNISMVDIMWVDVQGAELLVFQGAVNILKNTKIIMTEVGLKAYYQGHTLKTEIDQFLTDSGFYEIEESFEINVKDYEANTIYLNKKYFNN